MHSLNNINYITEIGPRAIMQLAISQHLLCHIGLVDGRSQAKLTLSATGSASSRVFFVKVFIVYTATRTDPDNPICLACAPSAAVTGFKFHLQNIDNRHNRVL